MSPRERPPGSKWPRRLLRAARLPVAVGRALSGRPGPGPSGPLFFDAPPPKPPSPRIAMPDYSDLRPTRTNDA